MAYVKIPGPAFSMQITQVESNSTNTCTIFAYTDSKNLSKLKEDQRPKFGNLYVLAFIDSYGDLHRFLGFAKTSDNIRNFSNLTFNASFLCAKSELIAQSKNFTFTFLTSIHNENVIYKSMKAIQYSSLKYEIIDPVNIKAIRPQAAPQYAGLDNVDDQQKQIILEISQGIATYNTNVFLIEGPPGTGKTRVLSNLVFQLQRGSEHQYAQKILVCAPSNTATDVIMGRLLEANETLNGRERLDFIRYGHVAKVNPKVRPWCLDKQAERKLRAEIKQVAEEYRPEDPLQRERGSLYMEKAELMKKLKYSERTDHQNELQKQISELEEKINKKEEDMYLAKKGRVSFGNKRKIWREKLLERAHVVCTTLGSSPLLETVTSNPLFNTLIVDEATVATEYQILAALRFGIKNLILIGDTKQLPVLVKSKLAKNLGLEKSLFERIDQVFNDENRIYKLQTQYRMHPALLSFPSNEFYSGRLKTAEITKNATSNFPIVPYLIFELESEQNFTQSHNVYNTDESIFVVDLLKIIDEIVDMQKLSCAIVSPYQRHSIEIKKQLE